MLAGQLPLRPRSCGKRRLQRLVFASWMAIIVLYAATRASAFNLACHYWAPALVIKDALSDRHGFSKSEAAVVAFCAELPDQAHELDAATQYEDCAVHDFVHFTLEWSLQGSVASALFGRLNSAYLDPGLVRMATVEQLLHGLTGGDGTAVTAVGEEAIRQLMQKNADDHGRRERSADDLCALGFAIHLLGDSYAHRELDGTSRQHPPMYPTGRGHMFNWHYPDYAFYEMFSLSRETRAKVRWLFHKPPPCPSQDQNQKLGLRVENLRSYLERLYVCLDSPLNCTSAGATKHREYIDEIIALSQQAHEPDYGDSAVKQLLKRRVQQSGGLENYDPFYAELPDKEPACQTYVDGILRRKQIKNDGMIPDCSRAWQVYRPIVEFWYARYPAARAVSLTYADPVFTKLYLCARPAPAPIPMTGSAPASDALEVVSEKATPSCFATPVSRPSGTMTPSRVVTPGKGGSTPVQTPCALPAGEIGEVHFDFNKYNIRPQDARVLDKTAECLKSDSNAKLKVKVNGYCDSKGTVKYNEKLSVRRADAVLERLAEDGIAKSRMGSQGYGKTGFVASNETADGRSRNRRVELIRE